MIESEVFYIYVDPHDPATPWVIRYLDGAMPEGLNETRVSSWYSEQQTHSFQDPFLEAKLGRYMIEIKQAVLRIVGYPHKRAVFTKCD